MAYEQGIATSKEDFIDKLTTFAQADGWTLDEFNTTSDRASIHLNSIFVHFRWDSQATGGITCFHSLGYDEEAVSAVPSAAGSGYLVNDTIVLSGGTFVTAATFNVDTIGGSGEVLTVSPTVRGQYSVAPSNPVTTTGGTGTGCTLTVTFQGVTVVNHVEDSGNGDNSGDVDSGRQMNDIGNGPYVNHWFFSSNEDGADYLYAVLEYDSGKFSSFCCGELVKFGTWTGGEFCGMTSYEQNFNIPDARHSFLLDGQTTETLSAATIHCEGLPSQPGGGKWAIVGNTTLTGTDEGGTARVLFGGGARGGQINHALQGMAANPNSGFIPMIPYLMFYRTNSITDWRFMGKAPHLRELNGSQLIAAEEFTIGGSEVWKVFPYTRKISSGTPNSGNAFFAIRKIV